MMLKQMPLWSAFALLFSFTAYANCDQKCKDFIHAGEVADLAALKKGLADKVPVDSKNSDGRTALMQAVIYGSHDSNNPSGPGPVEARVAAIELLISAGANPNIVAPTGESIAHFAVYVAADDIEILKAFLKAKPNLEVFDADGITPLMQASGYCTPDAALALIESGAKLETQDDQGRTAIRYSVGRCAVPTMRALIQAGADVHTRDHNGVTPLIAKGTTYNPEYLEVLLKAGANVNERANDGTTALFNSAMDELFWRNTEFLISKGANVNLSANDGTTPLMSACIFSPTGADLILAAGATVNNQNQDGMTALMYAVSSENIVLVRDLLKKGADKNMTSKDGKTAAMQARDLGYNEIAQAIESYRN